MNKTHIIVDFYLFLFLNKASLLYNGLLEDLKPVCYPEFNSNFLFSSVVLFVTLFQFIKSEPG